MALKRTPLYKEHLKLKAKIISFAGWEMPLQYQGILAEYKHIRTAASLFDTSHMGEFIVYGNPKRSNLERILPVDLNDIPTGNCRYSFMLNEKGGMIDDLIIYKINQNKWMLVVNAGMLDKDKKHLQKHLSQDAKLENLSEKIGKLDLQGPLSQEILKSLIGPGIEKLKYYQFAEFMILGEKNIISRTGYTGELGYELYLSKDKIRQLWNILLNDKRVEPAGLGARDVLRMEMGYLLSGQDIKEAILPLEASLTHFINFDKDFIGRTALLKEKSLKKKLIYFTTNSRQVPRHNYKIYSHKEEIGVVTSGSFSPHLSCGIGIGYIKPNFAKRGAKIILKEKNIEIAVTISKKPFIQKRGKNENYACL